MDITFVDVSRTSHAITGWSVSYDRSQALTILHQAADRAALTGHDVLASITLPVAPCAPLHILRAFRRLEIGECIFWGRPDEQRALVGVGAVTTIETSGPMRFSEAAATWRTMQRDAVIHHTIEKVMSQSSGPMLFGGFAFDPLNARTPLWDGFPDGLLTLPYLLYACNADGAALTINKLLKASDDVESIADEISASVERLRAMVESIEPRWTTSRAAARLSMQNLLPAAVWMEQVASVARMIQQDIYDKVVLARGVRVTREGDPFDIEAVLHRLRVSYPESYVFAIQRGQRYFVGATPERLIRAQSGRLQTMALAGSAPRSIDEEEDRRIGEELLQSAKNKREHAIVVATIRDALLPLCSQVEVAGAPRLLRLRNIQHLQTPIAGQLLPEHCMLEAIQDLFPTPAVGGFPRQESLAAIRAEEGLDRGWYAGPIGWLDADGNGEFAVALRCGLIDGNQATLFAGCGIMADSNPESEYDESCWKFQVMLRALGEED
jgi:isochorismate synthase